MEEKERYEIHMCDDCKVDSYDNNALDKLITNALELQKLFNYQDREINRLTKMLYTTIKHADKLNEENNRLNKELKKCKQSQKQLAISELEKVKTKFNGKRPIDELASEIEIELGYTATQINNFVENQIEKLKGNYE